MGSVIPEIKINDFGVKNEPVLGYLEGSKERIELQEALQRTAETIEEVPIVIGSQEFKSSEVRYQVNDCLFNRRKSFPYIKLLI